ncbi:MAG: glutathione S-transferase [Rhizobiales bacterium]|nr:glutathione S-transferase [Hyphomicrobiales bacterium]
MGMTGMKLFYSPGACSMAIHTLLEEIGKPFELEKVNLRNKEQFSAAYTKLNPKSQVPALQRDDGSVLTELVAIATWLADTNPERHLLPDDPNDRARLYEIMVLVNGNMHPQGITRIYRTDKFTPNEADYEAIRTRGREIVKEGVGILSASLRDGPFFLDRLTIADFVIFYMEYWIVFRLKWQLPHKCAVHYGAMMARPSVKRALETEGHPFQQA